MADLDLKVRRSSIRAKRIRCGRSDCKRCPHGPYLYRVWREGKKVRTEYLGRATALVDGALRADPGVPVQEHPYRLGDRVRFIETPRPYWVTAVGKRYRIHDSRPPLRVVATGWGIFGRSQSLYAYVTLETPEGEAVFHPYDPTLSFTDPAGRLDRRFPTPLLVREPPQVLLPAEAEGKTP